MEKLDKNLIDELTKEVRKRSGEGKTFIAVSLNDISKLLYMIGQLECDNESLSSRVKNGTIVVAVG